MLCWDFPLVLRESGEPRRSNTAKYCSEYFAVYNNIEMLYAEEKSKAGRNRVIEWGMQDFLRIWLVEKLMSILCSRWTDDGLVVGWGILVNRNHTFVTIISFTRRLKKTFSKKGVGQCNVPGIHSLQQGYMNGCISPIFSCISFKII